MPLPTQKTKPKARLADYTILCYGQPKAGKTTWCAEAKDALFLATEPGLNALEVYQVPIKTWDDLLKACAEIAEGDHGFKTVIIDTIDNAYRMCVDHICRKHGVEHQADLNYGKGYALINNEFHRVLTKIAGLPYGLYLVSHAQSYEVEGLQGTYTRTVPTLPDKARKMVLGLVDMILFCDLEKTTDGDGKAKTRRVMRTKPSQYFEAGDRTGRLPEVIELDYKAFEQAFAEGQDNPTHETK